MTALSATHVPVLAAAPWTASAVKTGDQDEEAPAMPLKVAAA